MGKYLQPQYLAWQLPLMAVFLIGWLFGGAYLLQRAFEKRLPRRAVTYGRCVLASLLSGGAAAFAGGVVYLLIITIAERLGTTLNYVGLIPAVLLATVMFYVVVHAMFDLPPSVVVRRGALPIGAILLLGLAVGAGVFLPARRLFFRQMRRAESTHNLYRIQAAILQYEQTLAKTPPSLTALVERGEMKAEHLRCPSIPNREIGYFYLPFRSIAREAYTEKLRACEFTHDETSPSRLVLFGNGEILPITPADFERLLALGENGDFAGGFREADRR